MGRQQKVTHFCDRCERVIVEFNLEDEPDMHEYVLKLRYLHEGELVGFDWQDLCAKCGKRVADLIDMIRMKKTENGVTVDVEVVEEEPVEQSVEL